MKKLFSFLFLFLFISLTSAQGIKFYKGNLEDALKKASKKDKLVFVDAYTSWCGPCKMMARDVFTDEEVGAFFKKNFISIKLDQEKGEGIDFAKKYEVVAYPTLLFLTGEGELAHKAVGYHEVQELLNLAEDAMNEEKQILALSKLYNYGFGDPMKPELLKNYANALKNAWMLGAGIVALDYINSIDEATWLSKENAPFILEHFPHDIESKLFNFIIENKEEFASYLDSKEELDDKINESLETFLFLNEDLSEENILNYYKSYFPKDWKKRYSIYEIAQLKKDEEMIEAYLLAQLAFFETYGVDSWKDLNALAWNVYQRSDDPEILETAREVAMKSIKMDENYYNVDTYVWLSHKLGDIQQTIFYGNKAVELGKAEDFDVSELEEMLNAIPK